MLKFGIKPSLIEVTIPEYVAPANWIVELGEGIAVVRMEDYNPERKEWIDADYFDKDLNFLGKIKLPWFYWWNFPGSFRSDFLFYSKGKKLYFIQTRETPSDEESWLVRYRVETGTSATVALTKGKANQNESPAAN
ncbi:MAG: hypothetical protein GY765_31845 [bacterium]|nr:hypothetical protein [bacterium]